MNEEGHIIMLMVVTALYCEAKPLIDYYQLKKDNTINKFQVFRNEDMLLIITNTGSIAAAVGTAFLCNLKAPEPDDFLINIGVCGSWDKNKKVGSLFLCNKITEQSSQRSFYPDILFQHPLEENEIVTLGKMIQDIGNNKNGEQKPALFDMEAAGIYQAGAYYFQTHQMSFLKIISDYGEKNQISSDSITALVESNRKAITALLDQRLQIKLPAKQVLTEEEEAYLVKLSEELKCTVTMQYQLRQLLLYYKLSVGSFTGIIKDFEEHTKLPCKTKAEGKMYFEQLKAKLV